MLNGCTKSKEILYLCETVYRKLGYCNCYAYMVLCSCCGFYYKITVTKWSVLSSSSLYFNTKLSKQYILDVQKNLNLILLWIIWLFPSLFGIISGIFLILGTISVSEINQLCINWINNTSSHFYIIYVFFFSRFTRKNINITTFT